MPVFFTLSELSVEQSSLLLSVTILGGAIFQPIIGYLADQCSNRAVILGSSTATIISGIYFAVFERSTADFIMCFLWGGFAFANYTMALKELGDRYSDERLMLGSAVLAMIWAVSTIFGLPLMGIIISPFEVESFPYFVVFLYLVVILVCLLGKRRAPHSTSTIGA